MSDTPLRDKFEEMMARGKPVPDKVKDAMMLAFMQGANAHDTIFVAATATQDPQHIAEVLDGMAAEMQAARRELEARY